MKKPKAIPKSETECFYCKGNGHWKWNCTRYLADKKDGKTKVYLIYMLLMCTLQVFIANRSVFDTSSVAKSSNSKRELQNKQRLVQDEVTMCVGNDSKVDKITIAHSLYLRD